MVPVLGKFIIMRFPPSISIGTTFTNNTKTLSYQPCQEKKYRFLLNHFYGNFVAFITKNTATAPKPNEAPQETKNCTLLRRVKEFRGTSVRISLEKGPSLTPDTAENWSSLSLPSPNLHDDAASAALYEGEAKSVWKTQTSHVASWDYARLDHRYTSVIWCQSAQWIGLPRASGPCSPCKDWKLSLCKRREGVRAVHIKHFCPKKIAAKFQELPNLVWLLWSTVNQPR